ncbi:MAG: ankyrin repeat domain-containing protein [Proteobacteria bacterium]|nr:ankyrin repeat domain-containing protein [Pseudomonadota bacterium]
MLPSTNTYSDDEGYQSFSEDEEKEDDEPELDFAAVAARWRQECGIANAPEIWVPRLINAAHALGIRGQAHAYITSHKFDDEACIRLLAVLCRQGDHTSISYLLQERNIRVDAGHPNSPVFANLEAIDKHITNSTKIDQQILGSMANALEALLPVLTHSAYVPKSSHISPVPYLYHILYRHKDKLSRDAYDRLSKCFFHLVTIEEISNIPIDKKKDRAVGKNKSKKKDIYIGNTLMIAAHYQDENIFVVLRQLDTHKVIAKRIYEVTPNILQTKSITHSAFMAACANQKLALLIMQHWPPNAKQVKQQDVQKRSPLWYAYYHGHHRLIRALKTAGAVISDENEQTKGCNMLMAACRACHIDWVKMFLKTSNGRAQDEYGNTAMHYIARADPKKHSLIQYSMVINILLDNSYDLNATNKYGVSPLIIAVLNNNIPCVKALLVAPERLNINQQDNEGKTALIHAVEVGNWEMIALLLKDRRTNPRICDKRGLSALMIFITLNCNNPGEANKPSNSSSATSSTLTNIEEAIEIVEPKPDNINEKQQTSFFGSIRQYAASSVTWVKQYFTQAHQVKFKNIDSTPLSTDIQAKLRLFMECGNDPGPSYGYDGYTAITSISIPILVHKYAPKILSITLPERVANWLIWIINSYFIEHVVHNMVHKFVNDVYGTAENVDKIVSTDYGLFHLNYFGLLQYRAMDKQARDSVVQKFQQHPGVIYRTLIERYMRIEQNKYSILHDGSWWNIPLKLCTLPWRIYQCYRMQEQIIKTLENSLQTKQQNAVYISSKTHTDFMQYLKRALVDDVLLRRLSTDADFNDKVQHILAHAIPVTPDVYSLAYDYAEAQRCRHYNRIRGTVEDIWYTIRLAVLDVIEPMDLRSKKVSVTQLPWWEKIGELSNKSKDWQEISRVEHDHIHIENAVINGGSVPQAMSKIHGFFKNSAWLQKFDPATCGRVAKYSYSFYCSITDASWLRDNAALLMTGGVSALYTLPYLSFFAYTSLSVGIIGAPLLAWQYGTHSQHQDQQLSTKVAITAEEKHKQDAQVLQECIKQMREQQASNTHTVVNAMRQGREWQKRVDQTDGLQLSNT